MLTTTLCGMRCKPSSFIHYGRHRISEADVTAVVQLQFSPARLHPYSLENYFTQWKFTELEEL